MKRLIIFLICKKLKVKLYQKFQFENQKTKAVYYFTKSGLMKEDLFREPVSSNVRLNWLLDDECKVIIVNE